jgi:hypothetical protein
VNSLAERAILSVAVATLRHPQDDAPKPIATLRRSQDDTPEPIATLRRPQDDTPEPIATLRRPQDDTPTYGFFGLSNVVVDFVFCCITSSFTQ